MAHMPLSEVRALAQSAGGSLTCKATTDPRLRECTGAVPGSRSYPAFALLVSSVRDTAAVIVLTARVTGKEAREWVGDLTRDFGTPSHRTDRRSSESWQWVRKGQMLRVIGQTTGAVREVAVTLTDGPLLDALGPPPSLRTAPVPKKKTPD